MMASGAVREKSEIERAGEAAQLRARAGHDCYDRLGAISAPTLVAAGEFDGLAPLANSVTLAARIHDCHLRIYQGGHLFSTKMNGLSNTSAPFWPKVGRGPSPRKAGQVRIVVADKKGSDEFASRFPHVSIGHADQESLHGGAAH
jgi:hypothetical protein